MIELKKRENESEEAFIWRLGQAKDNGQLDMEWDALADIINSQCRTDETEYRNESAYRKPYQQAKRFYEAGVFKQYTDDTYLRELQAAKHDIRQEKQGLFDERAALNRILREQGRIDTMYDTVKRAIEEHKCARFDYSPTVVQESDNDLIIHLTDVHCGITIDTPFNKFNGEILGQRLKKYLDAIYDIKQTYHSQNAYVIIGGDLIQGLIHTNSRIEAKENVVEQIMIVTDYISDFLYELSKWFDTVKVYSTAGNHARSMMEKDEVPRGENFDLLIPFACKKELQNIKNIIFEDNYLSYDIAVFNVRGWNIYATHGDKDSPKNVVYHMTQFARKAHLPLPDICYLGHRHTNGLSTVDDVKVIESGCVDGMDSFSIDKRLVGTPEQTVTVVTAGQRIKALCDIQID